MKKFILITFLCSVTITLWGQKKLNSAGNISVKAGTKVTIKGDFQATKKSNLKLDGNMTLTGEFINDATEGTVFNPESNGTFEFISEEDQSIKGLADKGKNYIAFPNVKINNLKNVFLDPKMAMDTKDLNLARGTFVLQSAVDGDPNTSSVTQNAHLRVKGQITPERQKDKGMIHVELALGDNYKKGNLVGFTPPFKQLYSDYFTFNYLAQPGQEGLFGESGQLISSPKAVLNSGQGYIVGLGIVDKDKNPGYFDDLSDDWGTLVPKYTERVTEKFVFGREKEAKSFNELVKDLPNAYSGEVLNTTDVNIPIRKGKGFVYLGNPYTMPLDLSSFVDETDNSTQNWGVIRSADGTQDVRNRFYVMSGGAGKYNKDNNWGKFTFSVSYLVGQKVGSTINPDADSEDSRLIAPMQMFIIYKDKDEVINFNIPESARKHGNVKYMKNRSTLGTAAIEDEVLIETTDNSTGGYDRLCVVFRDNATLKANDPYDATKIFNRSKGVNQIYTKSSDNKNMTTNVISPTTDNLTMYLEPTSSPQKTTLKAYRLRSLRSVNYLVLEDTKTGVKTDLFENPTYTFTSQPEDKIDRFVLHFTKSITGIEDINRTSELTAYYKSGVLTIDGLTDDYINSNLSIVDTRGTLVHKTMVDQAPTMHISTYLNTGVYLIRIAGKTNKTIKLLVTDK